MTTFGRSNSSFLHLEGRGLATSRGLAMALAPGLARKVKKVLETSLESPEILSCLRSLSEFYPENTPEARRGLRRSVEQHGLSINREYLTASSKAQVALRAVDGQLERLLGSCDVISSALERTRERTGELLRETASLDGEIASIEEKQQIVQTFAVDFQLTDEDVAALEGTVTGTSTGTDTTSDSNQIDTKFFTALTRARTIHGNCKRLLRTHHQRAGLELMDQVRVARFPNPGTLFANTTLTLSFGPITDEFVPGKGARTAVSLGATRVPEFGRGGRRRGRRRNPDPSDDRVEAPPHAVQVLRRGGRADAAQRAVPAVHHRAYQR